MCAILYGQITNRGMFMSRILQHHLNVQIPVEVLLHENLSSNDKVVFSYMKLRYQFFKLNKLPYCESNTTIASAIGLSRSTVIRSITKLMLEGFVTKDIRNTQGVDRGEQTNIYTVKDCLSKIVHNIQDEDIGFDLF